MHPLRRQRLREVAGPFYLFSRRIRRSEDLAQASICPDLRRNALPACIGNFFLLFRDLIFEELRGNIAITIVIVYPGDQCTESVRSINCERETLITTL